MLRKGEPMILLSDLQPSKRRAGLLTFSWGRRNQARYTTWSHDLVISPHTFVSVPAMEIDLGKKHAGLEGETATVAMRPLSPLTELTQNAGFPTVHVTIEEVDPGNYSDRRLMWEGMVTEVVKNAAGRQGVVEATITSYKSKLAVPLGIAVTSTCPWVFGDSNCKKNIKLLAVEADIYILDRARVNVGVNTDITDKPPYYWKFGWMVYDGLALTVTNWKSGNALDLKEAPPAYWLGKTVKVYPGCDKEAATCRDKWDNAANFCGLGIKVPSYNPIVETR